MSVCKADDSSFYCCWQMSNSLLFSFFKQGRVRVSFTKYAGLTSSEGATCTGYYWLFFVSVLSSWHLHLPGRNNRILIETCMTCFKKYVKKIQKNCSNIRVEKCDFSNILYQKKINQSLSGYAFVFDSVC